MLMPWWDAKAQAYKQIESKEYIERMTTEKQTVSRDFLINYKPHYDSNNNFKKERCALFGELIKEYGWETEYYTVKDDMWKRPNSYIWDEWTLASAIEYHKTRFNMAKYRFEADAIAREKWKDYVVTYSDNLDLLWNLGSIYEFDRLKGFHATWTLNSMCACCGTIGIRPSKGTLSPRDSTIVGSRDTKKIVWSFGVKSEFYKDIANWEQDRFELQIEDGQGNTVFMAIIKEKE